MISKMSWNAVLAGGFVAIIVHLICDMMGIGIGIGTATLDPGAAGNPAASWLSVGIGIRLAVSGILAALVGAYIARLQAPE